MIRIRAFRPRPAALVVPLALLALPGLDALAEEPTLEPPGAITFVGRNAISTAEGTFHRWRITSASIDRADPSSGFVEVEVDVASLDTGNEDRDEHLRTADFFEVETWPTASVLVHGARPDGETEQGQPRYTARFTVRIRDVEKTLDGSFAVVSETPPTVEGELLIDRVEFGIGEPHSWWNPLSIREEVPVRFTARFP